jgi:hypothetical protein
MSTIADGSGDGKIAWTLNVRTKNFNDPSHNTLTPVVR